MSEVNATEASPATIKGGVFVTTRWTYVLEARGKTPEAKLALSELCETYWTPVFRFLRREGRNEDAARELTQEFFARILARDGFAHADPVRGRFRSFLLGAVKHFLSDIRARESAEKRGGGTPAVCLPDGNATDGGLQLSDHAATTPDTYFDRQWAFSIMDHAFSKLSEEMAAAGKTDQFTILKPWLAGDSTQLSQATAANSLGLREGAVKVAIHRLRKRFRELVRSEITQTVPDPADEDAELRYLIEVLAAG